MDPKQLLLRHFEKGVLAVFGAWLLLCLVGFFSTPPRLESSDEFGAKLTKIDEYMNGKQQLDAQLPAAAGTLKQRLDGTQVAAARELPGWLMHRRPNFFFQIKGPPPKHEPIHRPPVGVDASVAERGKVEVKWQPSLENEYVVITNYELFRKVGEQGEWEQLAALDGRDERYVDETIQSRQKYFYKVVSIAAIDRDNPVAKNEGMTLPEELTRMESGEAGPVETAREVFILPQSVIIEHTQDYLIKNPNPEPEKAYLVVHKWDPESNAFVEKSFLVTAGQPIGESARLRGGRTFDFTTGAVLDDVWTEKRKHALGHDEEWLFIKVRWPNGKTETSNNKEKPAELGGGN